MLANTITEIATVMIALAIDGHLLNFHMRNKPSGKMNKSDKTINHSCLYHDVVSCCKKRPPVYLFDEK